MSENIPFELLSDVVLQCGSIHESYQFCINALEQIASVVPFDQGRVYFLNDRLNIFDEHLLGVDPAIVKDYRERYSMIEGGRYSISMRHRKNKGVPGSIDWAEEPSSGQFIQEYLRPQNIHFSTGMQLPDLSNRPRVLFCMDRTGTVNYTEAEIHVLKFLCGHLSNLYQNFFAEDPAAHYAVARCAPSNTAALTKREQEVIRLIMRGSSPQQIADVLYISKGTAIKHISHIYEKYSVNSRAELSAKVLAQYRQIVSDDMADY